MFDPSAQFGHAIPVQRSPSPSSSSEPEINTFGAYRDANPKIPIEAQPSSANPSTIRMANALPGSVRSEAGASKPCRPVTSTKSTRSQSILGVLRQVSMRPRSTALRSHAFPTPSTEEVLRSAAPLAFLPDNWPPAATSSSVSMFPGAP